MPDSPTPEQVAPAEGGTRLLNRTPALFVCVLAILGSGIAHGYLDGRWVDQPNLQRIGDQLTTLPNRVGDWELATLGTLDEQAQQMLQCHGSLVREYWNPVTGQRVNVAVLFGPRGPIAVHVPEICYSSQGTQPSGPRTVQTIQSGSDDHSLWSVQFRSGDADEPHLEVWYGWSDGGHWQAAKYPRVWMTDRLYKIQVAGQPGEEGQPSAVERFLEEFLPALNQALAPPA